MQLCYHIISKSTTFVNYQKLFSGGCLFFSVLHVVSSLSRVAKWRKLRSQQTWQYSTPIVISASCENMLGLSKSYMISVPTGPLLFLWGLILPTNQCKHFILLTSFSQFNRNICNFGGMICFNCVWHIKILKLGV